MCEPRINQFHKKPREEQLCKERWHSQWEAACPSQSIATWQGWRGRTAWTACHAGTTLPSTSQTLPAKSVWIHLWGDSSPVTKVTFYSQGCPSSCLCSGYALKAPRRPDTATALTGQASAHTPFNSRVTGKALLNILGLVLHRNSPFHPLLIVSDSLFWAKRYPEAHPSIGKGSAHRKGSHTHTPPLKYNSLLHAPPSLHWQRKSASSSFSWTSALLFLVWGVRRKGHLRLHALKRGISISKGQEQTRNKISLCQRLLMKMNHPSESAGVKDFIKLKVQGLTVTASGLHGVFMRKDWQATRLCRKTLINENYRVECKWYPWE